MTDNAMKEAYNHQHGGDLLREIQDITHIDHAFASGFEDGWRLCRARLLERLRSDEAIKVLDTYCHGVGFSRKETAKAALEALIAMLGGKEG